MSKARHQSKFHRKLVNFSQVFPTSTTVNQGDARIDQTISSRQSMFARFTYKEINTLGAPSNAVFGSTTGKTVYSGIVVADTYTVTPHLINEFRAGTNGSNTASGFNASGPQLISEVGITGITDIPSVAATPNFAPGPTESGTGNGTASAAINHVVQMFDNVTWVKGKHTMKFGVDVRRIADHYPAISAFGSNALGQYSFTGASVFAKTAANPSGKVGDAFTQFLLGYPDSTLLAESTDPGMSAFAYAEGFYAQDTWNVTSSLCSISDCDTSCILH